MAYLQFMNGSRDQQVEELNPAASLVVGSADDAHVRVGDAGVEARHCQVYPAQGAFWLQDLGAGNTILHMKRLKGTTEGLKAGDIFILGQTFVKFWTEKPTVGAAAPAPAAAGGPALDALKRELSAAQAEAARLKADVDKARGEGERSRADGDLARKELETLRLEVTRVKADVERERQEKEQVERQRKDADEQRERTEAQRQELEAAREELERRVKQLEGELETTRSEATAEVARARADADAELGRAREALEREQAEMKASLEATRAECATLRARDEVRGRDRLAALAEANDLSKVIEALALPDALRLRLEAAVEDAASREALRRVNGPVVPLRGLRVPGCDRDLEGELGAVRRRQEQVEAARGLHLHELEASQLDRLLEAARS